VWLVAVATTATASMSAAADGSSEPWVDQDQPLIFEVGAFGALAVGGHFNLQDAAATTGASSIGSTVSLVNHPAFALTADLGPADGSQQYELFYSREDAGMRGSSGVQLPDVTVEYLHLGGTVLLADDAGIKPYVAAGLGVTRFTPSEGGSTDARFSVSLGLGLRWPLTRHFSFRLEARGFATVVNSDTASFCGSGQNGLLCGVHGTGHAFVQGQFLAGAAYAF
jgi:opacity protein-like surface antigen